MSGPGTHRPGTGGPDAGEAGTGTRTGAGKAATGRGGHGLDPGLRSRLIAQPDLILGDPELLRALTLAREAEAGGNVIDIRGRAMDALEDRLSRLEAAHGAVISAAYENQTGMAVIHRAVLALLEPQDFAGFVESLGTEVAPVLRVDTFRLIMESDDAGQPDLTGTLIVLPDGMVAELCQAGRRAPRGDDIILRRAVSETLALHGRTVTPIRSEAILPLDLGPGRYPAAILMGSGDPARFSPAQGTDLLRFFAQVFRLVLLGWLRA